MTRPGRSVLLLSPYPSSGPSHRVRLEQYLPYLSAHGVHATVHSLLSEDGYGSSGPQLVLAVAGGLLGRLRDVLSARAYDAVLVHREATPLPTAAVERALARTSMRLVFDFDDAIYLPQPRPRSALSRWLRSPAKFPAMIAAADQVIAGNALLAGRAAQYARSNTVIPTTVDTDRIVPRRRPAGDSVVIGWIGSRSTAPYLDAVVPAIRRVLASHPNARFEMVGAPLRPGLGERASARPWSLDREVEDLQVFDVGIMPLADDEWTRGKCGYKALQYMSSGLAVVSSPVGVATEMIEEGRTGMLATSEDDWIVALTRAVEHAELRRTMGERARAFVVERYSLRVWAPRFLEAVLGSSGR